MKGKYEVLPQFSESDSDIDIFNAKSQVTPDITRKHPTKTKICLFSILFLVLVSITFTLLVHHHLSKQNSDSLHDSIVMTDCGPVSGQISYVDLKRISTKTYIYKGIPYAEPPIESLRWRAPVKNKLCWKGTLNATIAGSKCVQGLNDGSEDCLYLNVHTPNISYFSNLPVFVWIHGGNLLFGSGDEEGYSPDNEFVASMNVVSVSMNYRLNAFGFLTLEELWVPGESYGNYGLMDQILALKWVQKNIKNFGGDPNLVTICGQSSGGTSIFGLLVSPMADGLFQRAITMSGSPKFEKSYVDASSDNRVFINQTRCRLSENIHKCLYSLSAYEIFQAIPAHVYPFWSMNNLFDFPTKGLLNGALAVVDNFVIPMAPKLLFQMNSTKANVSVLIGSTAQEIGYNPQQHFNGEKSWTDLYDFLQNRTDAFSTDAFEKLWGILYKNDTNFAMNAQQFYETISTDVRITCPTNKLAVDLTKGAIQNVYQYVVSHSPYKPIIFSDHTANNAYHYFDSSALYGYKKEVKTGYIPSETDNKFMQSFKSLVLQFIKTGAPSWKADDTGVFNQTGVIEILKGKYHAEQCIFWDDEKNGFIPYAWVN